MRARDIMTSPAITVKPEVPVRGAAALLVSHGFTALPVVDDDKRLIGIVTEADLLRNGYSDEAGVSRVGDVMTAPVVAMEGDAPTTVLARAMVADRVRCLPIVDGSKVIGVVTRRDLVRALARTDKAITSEVQHVLDLYSGRTRKWTVVVKDGEATISTDGTEEKTRRVLAKLARSVRGVLDVRVLTGGER